MSFERHIIEVIIAVLVTAFGALAMPMGPTASQPIDFALYQEAVVAERINVHFAARAPLVAVSNVAVTGGVTLKQGSAFALRGQETVAAFFGFGADHIAPNRGADVVPDNVVRRDNDFSSTTNENGRPKSYLDEDGNLVPANPDGNISTMSQVRGGNSENSNVTSTTDPAIATNPRSYGNQEIEIDTGRLQADIDAGRIDGVSIRTPQQRGGRGNLDQSLRWIA